MCSASGAQGSPARVPPFGYLWIYRLHTGSPELFAVCHALRRLLAPRHPPYALSSLIHVKPRNCFFSHSIQLLRCQIPGLMYHQSLLSTTRRSQQPAIHLAPKKRPVYPEPLSHDLSIHSLPTYPLASSLLSSLKPRPFSSPLPVEMRGFEPLASSVQGRRSPTELHPPTMGHNGLEPLTFPLSEECSNLLS